MFIKLSLMKKKQLVSGLYQEFMRNGHMIRRLKRTELSCERIRIFRGLPKDRSGNRKSRGRSLNSKQSNSIPKIETPRMTHNSRNNHMQSNQPQNQYYKTIAPSSPFFSYEKTAINPNYKIKTSQYPSNTLVTKGCSSSRQIKHNIRKTQRENINLKRISESKQKVSNVSNRKFSASSYHSPSYKANRCLSYQNEGKITDENKSVSKQQKDSIYFNDQFSEIKFKNQRKQGGNIPSYRHGIYFLEDSNLVSQALKVSIQDIFDKATSENDKSSKIWGSKSKQNSRKTLQEKLIIPGLLSYSGSNNLSGNYGLKFNRKYSYKNLPLSSQSPSRPDLSLRESSAYPTSIPKTLEEVVERIEIHLCILELIMDFSESTSDLYQHAPSYKDFLCFMLHYKYFYQCSKVSNALKGGDNIFRLSNTQIPNQTLQQYINSPEIKQLLHEHQQKNTNFFHKLQTMHHLLEPAFKNNPKFTLSACNDSSVKQIIKMVEQQMGELYDGLMSSQITENSETVRQIRIIQIMEIVCLMSQLNGNKVKRVQFPEQIQDFDRYYKKTLAKVKGAIKHIKSKNGGQDRI